MRIRSGALRFSTASPEPIEMGSADAMVVDVMATVCAITGVRAAPTLGQPIWNTLADNACSSHINSLAPAVALPAPRHDRRRTGAAGSPPGGFPFLEGRLLSSGTSARMRGVPERVIGSSAQRTSSELHETPSFSRFDLLQTLDERTSFD